MEDVSKPGIDQLLIASALQPDLRRRLEDSPDEVFQDFDLTAAEQDILRRPDHRLLALLGSALARQSGAAAPGTAEPSAPEPPPDTPQPARSLPDIRLALAVVPCAQYENGQLSGFKYAVWVNSLAAGADPASLPPPPGAVFPGQPLAPLNAVIQVSVVQLQDVAGSPRVAMWASMRQASNVLATPPPEAAGNPSVSPFASDLGSEAVQAAVAAVRSAPPDERYGRILDLMRNLRTGDVR